MNPRPKLVAFFLPQFHPVPENDAWWGRGFTEWRNVARARPRFRGHAQPQLPGELGYYDLRVPEVRAAQAELARAHGIGAFCYYHYWFQGRRLLERPVNDLLARGEPDFPFCLCWANENWSRRWDGGNEAVLLEQTYSAEDDARHIAALLPVFADPRYLRHEGRPVFLVYRATRLPDARRTTDCWREHAQRHGLPGLHLLRVEGELEPGDPRPLGFDGAVDFQPRSEKLIFSEPRWKRGRRKAATMLGWPEAWKHYVYDYDDMVASALAAPPAGYERCPCVAPAWDNSPRRRLGAFILRGSTPARYEAWLRAELARTSAPFVFVNAWNEWAEGCHLEPCLRHGRAYLQATRRALASAPTAPEAADSGELAVVIPAYKGRHLERALASLAAQTDRRFRVYLADDASPENLAGMARPFCDRLQLEYRRFEENLGGLSLAGQWRRAIGLTSEPWIWLFSDDDEAEPGCVAAFHAARTEAGRPPVDLFRFNLDIVDEDGKIVERPQAHPPFENGTAQALAILGDHHRQWRGSHHIFSRGSYEQCGGFPDFPMAFFSDYAAWIAFGARRGVRTIEGARVRWRHHADSLSSDFGLRRRAGVLEALKRYARWLSEYGQGLAAPERRAFDRRAREHVLHLAGLLRPMPNSGERACVQECVAESWQRGGWRERRELGWVWLKSYLREKPGFRTLARWRYERSREPLPPDA